MPIIEHEVHTKGEFNQLAKKDRIAYRINNIKEKNNEPYYQRFRKTVFG